MPAIEGPAAPIVPDLALFPLHGNVVAFSPSAQMLVALNPMAAHIVRKLLQKEATSSSVVEGLVAEFRITPGAAGAWVSSTLESLRTHGLLQDGAPAAPLPRESRADEAYERRRARTPAYAPFVPEAEAHYRLLNTTVLVRFGHRAQLSMVDAVIGHLKTDEAAKADLVMEISASRWGENQLRSNIYCDGKAETFAQQLSRLGPLVKALLWTRAVNGSDFLLNLHAGVLGHNGRCILLPAEAGSGKSSLTTALSHAGLDYYSDEVALIDRRTLSVPPVPLAVCVKSTGWDLMSRYYPQIPRLPIHRRDDGKIVRYVPPPASAKGNRPAPVSHIFFPLYRAGESTRLEPLAQSEAFARLMTQCLALRHRLDNDTVDRLVGWMAGLDCYALTFSSLDEAVALVQATISRS